MFLGRLCKKVTPFKCILIRAQVAYHQNWAFSFREHTEQASTLGARLFNADHPDRDIVPNRHFSLWFYRGKPIPRNYISQVVMSVFIYFPNPNDHYIQSRSQICELRLQPTDATPLLRLSRKHLHDSPGNNVLLLRNMDRLWSVGNEISSRSLNLSEYEISCGPRCGMCAREYFVDDTPGQRVALLRRVKTNLPSHYVNLELKAYLCQPYVLHARRF